MQTNAIRVFLAHREAMILDLLVNALSGEFAIVGTSSSGAGLMEQLRHNECHVALISTVLQDGPSRGYAVLQHLRDHLPETRCVLLVDQSDRDSVITAFRSGAKGVFSSAELGLHLLCKCVTVVHGGQYWATNRDFAFVLEFISEMVLLKLENVNGQQLLTKREEQLIELLAEGLTNREIAKELQLSHHTIKNYLLRMFDKVGVSNRLELVMHAVGCGKRPRPVKDQGQEAK
jgi:DNA-binding NarL/FixJ family response regulator